MHRGLKASLRLWRVGVLVSILQSWPSVLFATSDTYNIIQDSPIYKIDNLYNGLYTVHYVVYMIFTFHCATFIPCYFCSCDMVLQHKYRIPNK